MKATLHTDGGARGNPGPGGIGAVLADASGAVIGEIAEGIGYCTNNEAEYKALIAGLELAQSKGITELDVFMDSQLVVSQMKGEWKIKSDGLRQLAVRARNLLRHFDSFTLNHVRREENAGADKLANQGMDNAAFAAEAETSNPVQGSFLE